MGTAPRPTLVPHDRPGTGPEARLRPGPAGAELPPALVLLNPLAGGGRARERWARVEPAVRAVCGADVVELDRGGAWRGRVAAALGCGTRFFVAAGGDGTVHALVEALLEAPRRPPLDALTLGAVGLGSSNDYHKPVARRVAGVPVRLGPGAEPRDVGVAHFTAPNGRRASRCFVVSASVGIVADANAFFSDGDRLQGWLRAHWTTGAILHAALRTIVAHRSRAARLRVGGRTRRTVVTSLSVSKTPYVSGSFRYDAAVRPADGRLLLCLCEGMTRGWAVRALADLARGRFAGLPGRVMWLAPGGVLLPERPLTLEADGETCAVRRVAFGVLPERIRVCR
jgi:diacylglycerol kinase (ATP)